MFWDSWKPRWFSLDSDESLYAIIEVFNNAEALQQDAPKKEYTLDMRRLPDNYQADLLRLLKGKGKNENGFILLTKSEFYKAYRSLKDEMDHRFQKGKRGLGIFWGLGLEICEVTNIVKALRHFIYANNERFSASDTDVHIKISDNETEGLKREYLSSFLFYLTKFGVPFAYRSIHDSGKDVICIFLRAPFLPLFIAKLQHEQERLEQEQALILEKMSPAYLFYAVLCHDGFSLAIDKHTYYALESRVFEKRGLLMPSNVFLSNYMIRMMSGTEIKRQAGDSGTGIDDNKNYYLIHSQVCSLLALQLSNEGVDDYGEVFSKITDC